MMGETWNVATMQGRRKRKMKENKCCSACSCIDRPVLSNLENKLSKIFPEGFSIEKDEHGQLVVYTHLTEVRDTAQGVRLQPVAWQGLDDEEVCMLSQGKISF